MPKLRLLLLVLFSLAITFRGWSQTKPAEDNLTTSFHQELKFANHYRFSSPVILNHPSKSILLTETTSTLPSFTLSIPDKLPMFCAMEKKLTKLCNLWIKIRLPEKE